MITRRHCLTLLAATISMPYWARAGRLMSKQKAVELVAAWEKQGVYRVGVLAQKNVELQVLAAITVPTRAHGLLAGPDGSVLAVARRPGDWLMRWRPGAAKADFTWVETQRAFNGHVLVSRDGKWLYTTETDLETGTSLIGVREAESMSKVDEWPTHGLDAHELIEDDRGDLIVANGGVRTRPETGRIKLDLQSMDSSLVRLSRHSGMMLGQWRLNDPRLSLRHLAWNGKRLGIALQAEHELPEDRLTAPVLAIFDGESLKLAESSPRLAGYGGDIAVSDGHFVIACPRAGGLAFFDAHGKAGNFHVLPQACAVTQAGAALWAAGQQWALAFDEPAVRNYALPSIRLDNHWAAFDH